MDELVRCTMEDIENFKLPIAVKNRLNSKILEHKANFFVEKSYLNEIPFTYKEALIIYQEVYEALREVPGCGNLSDLPETENDAKKAV